MPSIEQIKKDIAEFPAGSNTYKYQVDCWGTITFEAEDWKELDDYKSNPTPSTYNKFFMWSISRTRDYETFKWKTDKDGTLTRILTSIRQDIVQVALQCIDAKHVRKTISFQEISIILRDLNESSPAYEDLLNILEYHASVTKTEPIAHKNNDVHRSNINGLLNILRKKYGNGSPTNRATTSSI